MTLRFKPKIQYDHPGGADNQEPHQFAAAEIETCRWVGTKLEQWYPGHAWHVECDIRQGRGNIRGGVVKIRLNGLMPANEFYVINMRDLLTDAGGRKILHAAGELLERYKIPRTGFSMDDWRLALNSMPILARKTGRGWNEPLRD